MDDFNKNEFNGFNEKDETAENEERSSVNEENVEADKVYEPENKGYNCSNTENNTYNYGSSYNNASQYNQASYNANTGVQKKKKNKGLVILCVFLALVVIATGSLCGVFVYRYKNSDGQNVLQSSSSDENNESAGSVVVEAKKESGALTTTEIAKIAKKSSVGVMVYSSDTNSYFFSSYSQNNGSSQQSGEGSGIIIELDNQGEYTYVATCAHVISDKNISVKILLEDGTTYDAEIVGLDEQTDVGLLRVKNKELQKNAAKIGKSSSLQVGQGVYAVGNPGGSEFFGSFTSGVISAIGRSINNSTGYTMECIQHDAAINPGNSGGALFNAQGQLIGINSSKIASTEYEGMSFAIPIDEAVEVINDLASHGYVPNRPKLGITYSLATKYNQAYSMIVQLKGLPSGTLVIASINDDSSLKNSDVQKGDMIVSVNGKKLDTADVLLDMIENGKVGDTLELGICRVNSDYSVKEFTVTATLVEDKGSSSSDEQETETSVNPYDYFNYFFGN